MQFKAIPGKQFWRPYLENTEDKKGLAEWLQGVEYLSSKHEALSSSPRNPHPEKKTFVVCLRG
jgi:hypothetical protein